MKVSRKSERRLQELTELAAKFLFGTGTSFYSECGQPSCACHDGERHGPYLRVTYREGGRTRGYYVPAEVRETVLEGLRSWDRFVEIARELAEENRRVLGVGPTRKARARGRR